MAARVTRLRTRAERLRDGEAALLRQSVLDLSVSHRLPERAVGEIVAAIDQQTNARSGWTFCMISPEANDRIVEWLTENSARPLIAVRLWAKLFLNLRRDTGEIMQDRAQLAASVGTSAQEVSRVMTQLEGIGAVSRKREGRGVRYFLSPLAGTHLTGASRTKAQAKAPKLSLVP